MSVQNSYNNYITVSELKECVMLAPEMNGKTTLYTVMKRLGVTGQRIKDNERKTKEGKMLFA